MGARYSPFPIHTTVPDRHDERAGRRQTPPADRVIRRYRDEDGHVWTVREVIPDYDRRGRPTLVFSNDATLTMRRVQDFPSDWMGMTDAELQALSRRR
jgi:hypothetical protein